MNEVLTQGWIQVFFLFLVNACLIIWFITESRKDWRHMDNKVEAIQKEMKDIHARLEKQDAKFKAHLLEVMRKSA